MEQCTKSNMKRFWWKMSNNQQRNLKCDPSFSNKTTIQSIQPERVSKWFVNNKIKVLDWPSQSPDLNPIEHLWDELDRRMKSYSKKNKEELRTILKHEWEDIGCDVTSKLVHSMSNRLNEVVKKKGGPTRY